jgi:hypothetical protein
MATTWIIVSPATFTTRMVTTATTTVRWRLPRDEQRSRGGRPLLPRRLGRGGADEASYLVGNRLCAFLVQTKRSRHPTQIDARLPREHCHFRLGSGWRGISAENQDWHGGRVEQRKKRAAVRYRIKTAGDKRY